MNGSIRQFFFVCILLDDDGDGFVKNIRLKKFLLYCMQ